MMLNDAPRVFTRGCDPLSSSVRAPVCVAVARCAKPRANSGGFVIWAFCHNRVPPRAVGWCYGASVGRRGHAGLSAGPAADVGRRGGDGGCARRPFPGRQRRGAGRGRVSVGRRARGASPHPAARYCTISSAPVRRRVGIAARCPNAAGLLLASYGHDCAAIYTHTHTLACKWALRAHGALFGEVSIPRTHWFVEKRPHL